MSMIALPRKGRGAGRETSGLALVFTLVVVAILSIVALEFAFGRCIRAAIVDNHANDLKAQYAAGAAIEFAVGLITADGTGADGLDDLWALDIGELPVGESAMTWKVTDESGKLNLNRLVDERTGREDRKLVGVLERLMTILEMDIEPVAALLDWIDRDGDVRLHGAEDSYYYRGEGTGDCKDASLDVVEELVLVKGFDAEMVEKLMPFVTVYSDGKINLNTAPATVIQALLPSMDEQTVEDILLVRGEGIIHSVKELGSVNRMAPLDRVAIAALMTAKSKFFSIEGTGIHGESKCLVRVVVSRERPGKVKRLFWRIEG